MKPPQPGTTVDERFSIEKALGEEYGATLYHAQDILLGRSVAFRLLKRAVFSQDVRSRNLLQLQRSRAFVHQNIVTIHDVVCKADIAYLVTDWVDGVSLAAQVEEKGGLDIENIIRFLGDLQDALEWVHQIAECGRLHPGNLLVRNGRLVLTEPYFIRVPDDGDAPWQSFLAPEQLDPSWSHGPKADFYAAAMLAGYLLVGGEVQPGVALSKQTGRSSAQLDAAFVVATQSNPTLRADSLTPIMEALRSVGTDDSETQDGDTVEFRSIFSDAAESNVADAAASNVADKKSPLDFIEPEELGARDPELQKSVDARLHDEPKRRRHDTIELDLSDEAVTIVKDANRPGNDATPAGEAESSETVDMLPEDTLEEKLPGFNSDVEMPAGGSGKSEPSLVEETKSNETDQFQMVSDQAIFDDSSLPSRSRARDEYDTLESSVRGQPDVATGAGMTSPETQAFQRPGMKAPPSKEDQRGVTGAVVFLVVLLALGMAAYVALRDKGNGRRQPVPKSKPTTKSRQATPPPALDTNAPQDTTQTDVSDNPVTDSAGGGDIQEDTVDASSDAADARDDSTVEQSLTDTTNNTDVGSLPPATDRKQFTCNAFDMALVTRRKTIDRPGGSNLKVIAKAYCVDKYEYPGKGAIPQTNVSLEQARQGCKSRGRRLCSASEWRGACGAKYPYRGAYEPGRCNAMVELGSVRPITPAGTFSRCRSGWGTYDMVGNVAEWTSAGNIHGGSYQLDGEEASCNRKRTRLDPSPKVGYRCCADAKRKDLK